MLLWDAGRVSGKSAGDAWEWKTGAGVPDVGGSDGDKVSEGRKVMDMDNKIYVSELEYARLCRIDGKVDALIEYINQNKSENWLDASVVKAIIGMDNFLDIEGDVDA